MPYIVLTSGTTKRPGTNPDKFLIFFLNSRIPYPDINHFFKYIALILRQILLVLEIFWQKIGQIWNNFWKISGAGTIWTSRQGFVRTKGAFSGSRPGVLRLAISGKE